MIPVFTTHTSISALALARLFLDRVVVLHGFPATIVSDRDPRFTSHFWRALFSASGTTLAISTAIHPQTDGQTEHANRTIEQILRNYVSSHLDNWNHLLAAAEFACNNSVQASTKQTPFFLNYGQHPLTALDTISPRDIPGTGCC